MGYTKTAIKSASWVTLLRGVFRSSGFIRTAILARILTPAQFGVFGIVAIILGLVEMFTETGINVFLIQKTDKTLEEYLDTAWTISILRGFIIGLIIIISTPLIANFFQNDQVIPLLLLSSLIPIFRGFINPAIINFQKELRFNYDFIFRTSIILIDSLTAIILALVLKNPVSLVFGLIAGAFAEAVISLIFLQPKPRFSLDNLQFREIIREGKWITFAGIMKYITDKTPDTVIGRRLTTTDLGYFQMAYRFTILPMGEITEIMNKVSFPIYVKISGDKARLKKALYKNALALLFAALPLSFILFFFSQPITRIVLGDQWAPIAPVMQILSLGALAFAINAGTNPLFLSVKKQNLLSLFTLARMITMAIIILPLSLNYGILGAAAALTVSYIADTPFRIFYTIKLFRS